MGLPDTPAAPPREVFGPFRVYERLGAGATSSVHRALRVLDDRSEVEIALKRLHPHLTEDEVARAAFFHEGRLGAAMAHPSICRFFEVGELHAQPFISMEYVRGSDLRRLLRECHQRRAPPPIGATLSLLVQLCEALQYLHDRVDPATGRPLGAVHRDVSPANLLVASDGQLKVADFGIAKSAASEVRTETGMLKGTLGYLAPEVLHGVRADRRADVFAIGVVAWELLTAMPLFTGITDQDTMNHVGACRVPPPSSHNPLCSPDLDEVVLRALDRDPVRRWPTARLLRAALTSVAVTMRERLGPERVAAWLIRREQTGIPDLGVAARDSEPDTAVTTARHERIPQTMPLRPRRFPDGSLQPRPGTGTGSELAIGQMAPAPPPGARATWLALGVTAGVALTTILVMALRSADPVAATESDRQPAAVPRQPAAPPGPPPAVPSAPRSVAAPARPEPSLRLVRAVHPQSRSTTEPYVARVCVDARGVPTSVTLLAGPRRLESRIVRALRRWRYAPPPAATCTEIHERLRHRARRG